MSNYTERDDLVAQPPDSSEDARLRQPFGLKLTFIGDLRMLCDTCALRQWEVGAVLQRGVVSTLVAAGTGRPTSELVRSLAKDLRISLTQAAQGIDELVACGLLVRADDPLHRYIGAAEADWHSRGWGDALVYHAHTNALPRLDYAQDPKGLEDKAMMREYLTAEHPPSNFKHVDSDVRIALHREVSFSALSAMAAVATNVAECSSAPLTMEEFSWFMLHSFGRTGTRKLPITGEHIAKTSPSGGSRHPTEAYAFVLDVDDIAPGVYHYNVLEHALDRIQTGDWREFVKKHITRHPRRPGFEPRIALVLSTLFERSMFRYRESRSYRVVHHDLGHLTQTAALLASGRRRPSYRGYSLDEQAVEPVIGVDGIHESAMAFCLIG